MLGIGKPGLAPRLRGCVTALVIAGVLLAVLYGKPKPPQVIEETETAVV